MKTTRLLAFCLSAFGLVGCGNMPTQPSQITGAYVPEGYFKNLTCDDLNTELASLSRRENQLVIAQEQRLKTSQVQAFWWGFGNGDGVEASELANVRGAKEAARKAADTKKCDE